MQSPSFLEIELRSIYLLRTIVGEDKAKGDNVSRKSFSSRHDGARDTVTLKHQFSVKREVPRSEDVRCKLERYLMDQETERIRSDWLKWIEINRVDTFFKFVHRTISRTAGSLRKVFLGSIFNQQSDVRIEPGTAGREAQTLPLMPSPQYWADTSFQNLDYWLTTKYVDPLNPW